MADLQAVPKPMSIGTVHKGFYDRVDAILTRYPPENTITRVLLTGHSLGGGGAHCGYLIMKAIYPQLPVVCVTFGVPCAVSEEIMRSVEEPREIVNFIDDLTGETISSLTVSKGGSLNPPTAPDHLNDGYVFVGWSGGSAENVQRNTTLYATYAPVRYVTIVLPDGSKNEIKVAFGSKLSDIEVPEFEGRKFDCWSSSSSITDKLSNDISIMYDTTIYAVYQSYWWIALIVLAVIMVVVIVIVIIKTR